jgi:hypothetical protein
MEEVFQSFEHYKEWMLRNWHKDETQDRAILAQKLVIEEYHGDPEHRDPEHRGSERMMTEEEFIKSNRENFIKIPKVWKVIDKSIKKSKHAEQKETPQMLSYINKKVLVTTQQWFYAPNGIQYRGVHGTLKAVHEVSKTLGFVPNRAHANWFIEIGSMIIMGCQVMYIVQCDQVHTGEVEEWRDNEKELVSYKRPTAIYITD